jgi:two-component system KDP operon response regulator KdpE
MAGFRQGHRCAGARLLDSHETGSRRTLEVARVLVIDDDPALVRALRLGLTAVGHDVTSATTGQQGIAAAVRAVPDVIVLDLGLPDLDGLTVFRRIREWNGLPIIVLSATATEHRKVQALDEGADDYVTKPFGMAELEARIRAALRRSPRRQEDEVAEFSVGPLEFDLVHREARLNGGALKLTGRELDVLSYLARHADKVCTHQMILSAVWGSSYGQEAQYLHSYIHRLRQKVSPASPSVRIETAIGIGYVLRVDAASTA